MLSCLLALTNGSGIAVAVTVSAWLLYLAAKNLTPQPPSLRGKGEPNQQGLGRGFGKLLIPLALAPLIYLAFYFTDYHRPAHHPKPGSGGVLDIVAVTAQTLSMAFGMGLSAVWPVVAASMIAVGAWTIRMLRKSAEPPAAVGLVAVVAGVAGIALAIGVGRAGMSDDTPMGIWSRYAFLTWPLLGLAYLAWVKFGTPWGAKWLPITLCMAAALGFAGNMLTGVFVGTQVKATLTLIEDESARGTPPEEIVKKFEKTTQANQEERAVRAKTCCAAF